MNKYFITQNVSELQTDAVIVFLSHCISFHFLSCAVLFCYTVVYLAS